MHDSLATIVGAGVDTFWFETLPAQVQVMLAIRLLAMAEEIGDDQHTMVSRVMMGPDGSTLGEITATFTMAGQPARPEYLAGAIVPNMVGFQASEEGTYQLEYVVDGGLSKSLPIHVVLGSPGG